MKIIRIEKKMLFFITLFFLQTSVVSQINTTPSNLSGLKLWLVADSCYSNILNTIDTIYDLSINKNHASQTINSLKPTYSVNILNGHKTILFDGIDDFMGFNEINDIKTVFWVLKENSTSPDYRPLLGHTLLYDFHRGYNNELYSSTFTNPFVLSGQTRVNSSLINGTTSSLQTPYNVISLVTTGNVSAEYFSKDRNNTNRVWNGELAELIIYNQFLSSIEVSQIEQYLYEKYAPPIDLPADISISNSVCDTTLTPKGYFNNYQWSTGATTQSISVNQSGKYWVTATNIFGKTSSDTIIVNYPSIVTKRDSTFCIGNNLLWDSQLPKSDFTFQWQDNSTDSVFTINQAGNYYVKITDSFGCSITSDTAHITIDNFSNTASLGPDLSLCAGNSISLISGISPSLTYTWSTGSNNDSLLINNTGQYSVIVTNTNNCVAKDTINVIITGQAPVANFTTSIGCKNNAVSFTDLSVPPSGNTIASYEWDFGDALSASNTSTLSNPFHTFSDTGNYSVILKVITNVGCEQSIIKTIHVAPKPLVNFTVGLSCQNDSTSFFGSITNPNGYTTSSLKWNFGDPSSGSANSSTIISPKHLFSNSTNYTIKLVATNNAGCKDSLINIIAVKSQVKADFSYSSACTNTATVFQDNSIVPAPNASNIRSWNFGTSTASGLTVSKSYTNSGVYSVTLSVTGNNGCNSSISKVITIFNPPITSFTIPTFCAKDTVSAINASIAQSGIISSYNWKLNNAAFSSVQNPTLSIASAGNYPVSLTIVNNFGCKDSLTKTITVNPLPIVDFTTSPTAYYYINSPITFSPSISNASFYLWNISTIPTTTIQSPTVTFNSEGTYTASLLLQDQQGCKNSITKNLTVTKRFLDIAVLNVNSIKDADGFVSVQTDIVNYGTIPASSIELNYQVSDGGNIKEIWTGTLVPNAYFTYILTSKVATQPQSTNHMTCVDAKKVNGISDQKLDNNKLCSALNSTELSVSNPIPNPTNSDITLPIILNKDMDFSISIYNSTGQIIYEEPSQKGVTGLNLISLPSSNYSRGCYIIKTIIDDKVFIKKFIKISNE